MTTTRLILTLLLTLAGTRAWAYSEVLDNAEVLNPGQFKFTGALQALTEHGGGNFSGVVDTGIQQDWGVRGLVGVGTTDFDIGAMVKWVPIPDAEDQPAVGLNVGLTYARWMDVNDTTLRFEPMASKKFVIDGNSAVTPYASLPLGLRIRDSQNDNLSNRTDLSAQLALGAQIQIQQWKDVQFIAELGLDLNESESYFDIGAIFYVGR